MSGSLFRAAALKKLSTPEDLDRLVHVTKPMGWAAGVMLALLIAAVLAWSFMGRLPSRIVGNGLVLPQNGRVVEVQSRGAGVVVALPLAVGDTVEAGQVVARLGETEGERDLVSLNNQLAERERDLAQVRGTSDAERVARAESIRRQRGALELRANNARLQESTLRERLSTYEGLFRDRLVTRAQVVATQNELAATRQELSNAASDAARLGVEELDLQRAAADRIAERQRAVDQVKQQIATATGNIDAQLVVRSPDSGRVVEVRTQPGALLRAGQAVIALEQRGSGYEVLCFVDSQDGKRVRPGMDVRIALASARREEFGTMLGTVNSVSGFPLSFEAIRTLIQNDELARSFMKAGPPFMVRLRLDPDPDSVSGYRWTSRRGDGVPVSSGIPASAEIVTEQRRPITMVLPALRGLLGS